MIITIQNKELEFVRPILRRVAKRYGGLLIHRERLSGKLQELTVFARWAVPEDTMSGFYRLDYDRSGIRHYIELHITPTDSKKSIAHLFAHELSHMLLQGSCDYVRHISGETRIPATLEESMADNMADFVVSHCRFADDTCSLMLHQMGDSYCREFAQLLAEGFGSPLEEAAFLDDFSITVPDAAQLEEPDEAAQDEVAWWAAYFSEPEGTCAADLWVHNYFWYLSVLGRFSEIPEVFDAYMGEGAFEDVCADMNLYHSTVRNGMAETIAQRQLSDDPICDDATSAKDRAFDRIRKFSLIRTREREEQNA